jgi:prepilin-type N-terminal cleavage/methylation domain-containing protein
MRRFDDQRGLGLAEMLVALTLAGLVATIMYATFFRSQRATQQITQAMDNRENSRTALQVLERDIRMAGSGWGRMTVEGCYNGAPLSILPITPGYGGTAASNDTVGIIGAWDISTTLSATMATSSSAMKVASVSNFAKDDFVVVTNGTNAHLFQVTGKKNSAPKELYHDTGSKYNVSGGHQNWPSGGYPVNARVFRVTWVSYRVDTTGARPMLVRREANQTPQLIAFDVSRFKVSYLLQDESITRNPDDPLTIDRVTPVISMVTTVTKKTPIADSSSTDIKPRSL